MGRSDGFTVADVSSGHLDDDKVRRLWRILEPSVADMTEAITLHLATVLGSWRSGKRVAVDEAVPLWLPVREDLVTALTSAKLLDGKRRVPVASWADWYGPAAARRAARVEAGRLGGLRSGEARSKRPGSEATATLNPTGRQAGPSVPSESVRPRRATRAARGGGASLRDTLRAEGGFAATLVDEADR